MDNWKYHSPNLSNYLSSLKDWEYMVEVKKPTRSLQQNRMYWAILEQIEKETGNDRDDLHNLFKEMFINRERVVQTSLGEYTYRPTTTDLSTAEFVSYIDKITLFCAENWIDIINL